MARCVAASRVLPLRVARHAAEATVRWADLTFQSETMSAYQQTWRELRIRQGALLLSILAFATIPFVVSLFSRNDNPALVAAVALAILAVAAGVWHHALRCPACGKYFFRRWDANGPTGYQNPFTSRCLNCGCPIGATTWEPKL